MALDRQSIERRDFPIARRGYEIEAVDGHLARLADDYEEIARRGRTASGGLAASAADQVRMIVEAAESSAADIERDAELEARRLRQDAREEAERVRADAGRQARDHVTRVAEVARGLLDRVEGMDRELGGLLDAVRAGTQRLSADLSLLQTSVEEVREAAAPEIGARPEPSRSPTAEGDGAGPEPAPPSGTDDPHERVPHGGAPTARTNGHDPAVEAGVDRLPVEPAGASGAGAEDDRVVEPAAWEPEAPEPAGERDGARMVALNMALNGVPREDTHHHIAQNFALDDVDALLDEVYSRAGR